MKHQHVIKERAWRKNKEQEGVNERRALSTFLLSFGEWRDILVWVNCLLIPTSNLTLLQDRAKWVQVVSASQRSLKLICDPGLDSPFLSDSYIRKPETVACFPWLITCLLKGSAGFISLSATVETVPASCFILVALVRLKILSVPPETSIQPHRCATSPGLLSIQLLSPLLHAERATNPK